jgi:hypothetical protein
MNTIDLTVEKALKIASVIFVTLFFAYTLCVAQPSDDSIFNPADTVAISQSDSASYAEEDTSGEVVYAAAPDSAAVKARPFNNEDLQQLKDDPTFDYKEPPTVAESLWDRFRMWLADLLSNIFNGAVSTPWGRVIAYVVGFALAVVLIMLILKVNAFKMLYSGEGNARKYQVLDEDIHEMDFDALINDALQQQDYRKGIRLLFLYALKLLSDRHLIHWQAGKTNHDYVGELGKSELRQGLTALSFYFEYAWYGNFNITHDTFTKAQSTFADWKDKLS